MKNRLLRILQEENMTSNKFAELMEVRPSNISHLTSGRNYPNFEFVGKMLMRMPNINPDWLINGVGDMRRDAQNDLFGFPKQSNEIFAQNVEARAYLSDSDRLNEQSTNITSNDSRETENLLTLNDYSSEKANEVYQECEKEQDFSVKTVYNGSVQSVDLGEFAQKQSGIATEVLKSEDKNAANRDSFNIFDHKVDAEDTPQAPFKTDAFTDVNTATSSVITNTHEDLQPKLPIDDVSENQQNCLEDSACSSIKSSATRCNTVEKQTPAINRMVVFYDDMTFEIYNPK